MIDALFQPFAVKSLRLKNRFVMSPMTRKFSPGGIPTGDVAEYYARRAANDVALVITEGVAVDRPASVDFPTIPRLHGEPALAGWRDVVRAVHDAGGAIAPQLWHIGASPETSDWTPPGPFEGPSGLKTATDQTGVSMSEQDIVDTIASFASAAVDSKAAGFDCIAIHGAHGYLMDQFFWDDTNQRTDDWGGKTLAERSRFGIELVKAVRRAVGDDHAIFLRISQWKMQAYHHQMATDPAALEAWVAPLADAGVDVFDCSQRRFWEPEFVDSDLNLAGWVKKLTGKSTMTVGSVGLTTDIMSSMAAESTKPGSLDELERRFDRGYFDLVAVGRALLSDAEWVRKVHEGRADELMDFQPQQLATLS